jgi:phosphate-selective porin OprO/OprP
MTPSRRMRRVCIALAILFATPLSADAQSVSPPPMAPEVAPSQTVATETVVTRLPPTTAAVNFPVQQASYPATTTEVGRVGLAPGQTLEERVAELEAQAKKTTESEKKKKTDDAKLPTHKFTMQLQADTYFFSQDEANIEAVGDIQDGSAFRRARVGWLGDHEQYCYRIEFDFALPGRPSFLDVWAGMKHMPLVGQTRVGHFFEPFCLDRITPNRFLTFMERASVDQAFAPARNLGVACGRTFLDEHVQCAAGVFRANSDNYGDDLGDNGERAVTGRVTAVPYYDEPSHGRYLVHFGAGYSFRDADGGMVRFRAQPEERVGATVPNIPFFVDTGLFPADYYQLFGLDTALVWGPLSIQSEVILTPVESADAGNPMFYGWYAFASYFLTGESRPYKREIGAFDRVIPFENFFRVDTNDGVQMGSGAWEVAVRYSHLDLDEALINGGVLRELTFGLNWYMTPFLHANFNYNHPFLDSPVNGASNADICAMRLNFDF